MSARRDLGYTAVRLVPTVTSTLGTLLLARTLGISEFGGYAAAFATTQIVTSIGLIGQDQLVLQGRLSLRAASLRAAIVVVLSSVIALTLGFLIVRPELHIVVAIVTITTGLMQWCSIPFAYMLVSGKHSQRARAEVWLRGSYQLGLNGTALAWDTSLGAAIGGLLGTVVGLGVVFSRLGRDNPAPPTTRAGWFDGARYGLDGLLYSLAVTFPMLVVAARGDFEANAQARIVFLAYTAVVTFSRSINGELYRAQLFAEREPEKRAAIWRSMRRSLLILGIATTFGLLLGAVLVRPIIGQEYSQASIGIALLAGGVMFQFFGYGLSTLAITNGHIYASILRQTLTLAGSIILSLLLSPGPIMLAIVLISGDVLTTVFFGLTRRRLA